MATALMLAYVVARGVRQARAGTIPWRTILLLSVGFVLFLPLANLAQVIPELRVPGIVAILDVGLGTSDLLILQDGLPVFARTLSVGAEAGGKAMVAALRQSQAAWISRGADPFLRLYLAGAGPTIDGASPVLSEGLGMAVTPHARSLLDLKERVEVAAAYSPSETRRADFANRYPFPTAASLDAILADPSIGIVAILTPPNTHLDIVG